MSVWNFAFLRFSFLHNFRKYHVIQHHDQLFKDSTGQTYWLIPDNTGHSLPVLYDDQIFSLRTDFWSQGNIG